MTDRIQDYAKTGFMRIFNLYVVSTMKTQCKARHCVLSSDMGASSHKHNRTPQSVKYLTPRDQATNKVTQMLLDTCI